MFRTEHLEGRLLYETDKVVCINVHLNSSCNPDRIYITQVMLSLVNGHYTYYPESTIFQLNGLSSFTKELFAKELLDGITKYLEFRNKLQLG